ncbi:MAG TPA: helix-hairpin-helix domain-containing protein, partial [Halanaerobiales bacterium]|nr:helix-hairpin-helix domain-containing protein [Halanaerobiales bacterium]
LTENIPLLKQVPGIGKKTAQRLILELKSKVDDLAIDTDTGRIRAASHDEELYQALQSLGYHLNEIDKAVSKINFDDQDSIEHKIKKVLSYLGKEY